MRRKLLIAIAWAMAVSTGIAVAQSELPAGAAGPNVVSTNPPPLETRIVTCQRGVDVDALVQEFGLTPSCIYRHALTGFAAPMDSAAIQRLKQDGRVRAVEKDGLVAPCIVWNFSHMPSGIARMGLTNFPVAYTSLDPQRINVDVAVLDSGIDPLHPDLDVYQSVGFADPGYNGVDWNGHGTWVAGIIGAIRDFFGTVGVAPGVRLWSVQVMGPTQSGWTNIIAGIDYIAQHADQISVVNASLGPTPGSTDLPCTAVHEAVSNLVSMGVVFVAGAGNNNGQDIAGADGVWGVNPATCKCDDFIPASLPEVMAVSAMDPVKNIIASFSNSSKMNKVPSYVTSPGLGIDVAAPGVNIYSTWLTSTDGYTYQSGTSGASPHVAGLVALYIAANGRATNAAGVYRIRQAIIDGSLPQSQWGVTNTMDPDGNPEPLAMPSTNWVSQPNILNEGAAQGAFQLGFAAVPGYAYTAQSSKSIGASNQWTNLPGAVAGTRSLAPATLTDTNPASPERFYRVAMSPVSPPTDYFADDALYAGTNAGSIGSAGDADGMRPLLGDPGIVGTCNRFSAFEIRQIQVPYLPALNPNGPFTVEFWARPTQLGAACPLTSVDTNGSGWVFYQNNTWEFQVGGLKGYAANLAGGSVQAFAWHHIVGVYDGTNITLYVNGQPVAGPTAASGFRPNASAPLGIGGVGDWPMGTGAPSSQAFDGWLDEVAIYTNALSANIIAAHYAAATTNNAGYAKQILSSRPVGYWPLDDVYQPLVDATPTGP